VIILDYEISVLLKLVLFILPQHCMQYLSYRYDPEECPENATPIGDIEASDGKKHGWNGNNSNKNTIENARAYLSEPICNRPIFKSTCLP
jgi:hypothetical protein